MSILSKRGRTYGIHLAMGSKAAGKPDLEAFANGESFVHVIDSPGSSVDMGADNGTTEMSSDRCDPESNFLKWLFKQKRVKR